MRYACALKANGLLRYASKPSACDKKSEVALDLRSRQVQACVLVQRFRPLPRRSHGRVNPAALLSVGSTRRVPRSSLCGRQAYGRERAITLPARSATFFCGVGRSHRLRWVGKASKCGRGELSLVVAGFKPVVANTVGGNQGNIVANNDTASTDEGHGVNVNVLANDTVPGPGNKNLTVTGLDTSGTVGTVTVNSASTSVNYDPAGHFNDLTAGQHATDTFRYRATDGPHTSSPATVTLTITGTNQAPVVTTSAGTVPYTEGDPATVVDS